MHYDRTSFISDYYWMLEMTDWVTSFSSVTFFEGTKEALENIPGVANRAKLVFETCRVPSDRSWEWIALSAGTCISSLIL